MQTGDGEGLGCFLRAYRLQLLHHGVDEGLDVRDALRNEWLLLAACHDLRKLHGKIGVTGLGALATA